MSIAGIITKDRLAAEATRLLSDEFLQYAAKELRSDALEALAIADADNKIELLRLQQRVAVIDEVLVNLSGYVLRAKPVTSGPV